MRRRKSALVTLLLVVMTVGWPMRAMAIALRQGERESRTPAPTKIRRLYRDQPELSSAATAAQVRLKIPYSDWSWPNSGSDFYSDIAEKVTIEGTTTRGASFFWAHQFRFQSNDADAGGYVGLQDGSCCGRIPGSKIALFSIGHANAVVPADEGGRCSSFNENGWTGLSCSIEPYDWQPDREYRLGVQADGSDSGGTWYLASVLDTVSRELRTIGRIRVPLGWGGLQGWTSWTEYFGGPVANCADLPKARVRWKYPTANGGRVKITGHAQSFGDGECPSKIDDLPGAIHQVAPK